MKNWSSSLAQDCGTGNAAGNTASQLQLEFPPSEVAQDQLLISALLTSNADVSVYFNDGETVINPSWDLLPSSGVPGEGGPGIYHTSVPLRHLFGSACLEWPVKAQLCQLFWMWGQERQKNYASEKGKCPVQRQI